MPNRHTARPNYFLLSWNDHAETALLFQQISEMITKLLGWLEAEGLANEDDYSNQELRIHSVLAGVIFISPKYRLGSDNSIVFTLDWSDL